MRAAAAATRCSSAARRVILSTTSSTTSSSPSPCPCPSSSSRPPSSLSSSTSTSPAPPSANAAAQSIRRTASSPVPIFLAPALLYTTPNLISNHPKLPLLHHPHPPTHRPGQCLRFFSDQPNRTSPLEAGHDSSSSSRPPRSVENLRNASRRLNVKFDPNYRPPPRQRQDGKWPSSSSSSPGRFDSSKKGASRGQRERNGPRTSLASGSSENYGKKIYNALNAIRSLVDGPKRRQNNTQDQEHHYLQRVKDYGKALEILQKETKGLRVLEANRELPDERQKLLKNSSRYRSMYNAVLSIALECRPQSEVWAFYNRMKKEGVSPNSSTFTILFTNILSTMVDESSGNVKRARGRRPLTSEAAATQQRGHDRKLHDNIDVIIKDLYRLWHDAFPGYFANDQAMQSKLSEWEKGKEYDNPLDLEEGDTEILRTKRFKISRMAAVEEAKEYPQSLSTALHNYMRFLLASQKDPEAWALFNKMCPDLGGKSRGGGGKSEAVGPLCGRLAFHFWLSALRSPRFKKDPETQACSTRMAMDIWRRWQEAMQSEARQNLERRQERDHLGLKDQDDLNSLGLPIGASLKELAPRNYIEESDVSFLQAVASDLESFDMLGLIKTYFGLDESLFEDLKPSGQPPTTPGPFQYIQDSQTTFTILMMCVRMGRLDLGYKFFLEILRRSDEAKPEGSSPDEFGPALNLRALNLGLKAARRVPDPIGATRLFDRMARASEGKQEDEDGESDSVRGRNRSSGRRPSDDAKRASPQKVEANELTHSRVLGVYEAARRKAVSPYPPSLSIIDGRPTSDRGFDLWSSTKRVFESWSKLVSDSGLDAKANQGAMTERYQVLRVLANVGSSPRLPLGQPESAREAMRLLEKHVGLGELEEDEAGDWIVGKSVVSITPGQGESTRAWKVLEVSDAMETLVTTALDTGRQGVDFVDKEESDRWKAFKRYLKEAKTDSIKVLRLAEEKKGRKTKEQEQEQEQEEEEEEEERESEYGKEDAKWGSPLRSSPSSPRTKVSRVAKQILTKEKSGEEKLWLESGALSRARRYGVDDEEGERQVTNGLILTYDDMKQLRQAGGKGVEGVGPYRGKSRRARGDYEEDEADDRYFEMERRRSERSGSGRRGEANVRRVERWLKG
ncbi:hypothetical protein IE53DRAFT_385564 [Violaceomyces palustris]|uniref:Uncharacterized protein n=1 Tax=Violaceomyces palustris TaxID=1673888 RepID=A0ACD0P1U5_9BASI|nr:hypothetical protein IE53DRAFT_385564 [Violaceomyces palustris]